MEKVNSVNTIYEPVEATIHTARYMNARPYVKGKKVLVAPCGEGYGSALLKQWGAKSVVSVDDSHEAISIARDIFSENELEFIEHNVEHLPFEDVSFDMAVSLETAKHMNDPESFLKELRRVVKAGGTIIISCSNDRYIAENITDYETPLPVATYSFNEFRNLAEKVLGETAKWYLGNTIAGFYNIPVEKMNNREPEIPAASNNKSGTLTAGKLADVLLVPPGHDLNDWNSMYYIGIWGESREEDETACVYPIPYFALYQNKSVPESTKMLREWESAYRSLEKNYKEECRIFDSFKIKTEEEIIHIGAEYDTLRQENQVLNDTKDSMDQELAEVKDNYRVLRNERDRLLLMNDMQKKEEALLWNQIHSLRAEHNNLKDAYQRLEQEKKNAEDLIKEMQNTRGWRLLTIIRKVLLFFGWRKRKNASG